jgi:hypothetical protein
MFLNDQFFPTETETISSPVSLSRVQIFASAHFFFILFNEILRAESAVAQPARACWCRRLSPSMSWSVDELWSMSTSFFRIRAAAGADCPCCVHLFMRLASRGPTASRVRLSITPSPMQVPTPPGTTLLCAYIHAFSRASTSGHGSRACTDAYASATR